MSFLLVAPDPIDGGFIVEKWQNGPVSVVLQSYALGQYRIQLWYRRPGSASAYPEVIAPEC